MLCMFGSGGEIKFYYNLEQEDLFIEFFDQWHSRFPEISKSLGSGAKRIWTPYHDEPMEGNWTHVYTNAEVNYTDWLQGQPNGLREENCGMVGLDIEISRKKRQWWIDCLCYDEVKNYLIGSWQAALKISHIYCKGNHFT